MADSPFDFSDLIPQQGQVVPEAPPPEEEESDGFWGSLAGAAFPPLSPSASMDAFKKRVETAPTMDETVRAMGRGLPIAGAYLDEANAATKAAFDWASGGTWRERYGRELAQERATDTEFDKKYPNASLALQILGGGLATAAVAPVAAPFVAPAPATVPLVARVGIGAGTGAGVGFAHGFGQGEGGVEERATEGLEQGAIGATLGAAIPAVARVAGGAYRGARNIWEKFSRGAGLVDDIKPPSAAESRMFRAASDDMVDPNTGADLGDAGMVMDLGPNLRQQAAYVYTRPGEGRKTIDAALNTRKAGATGRTVGALNEALGPEWDTAKTYEDLVEIAQEKARPLYKSAYDTPIQLTENLQRELAKPTAQTALANAQRMMLDDGVPVPNLEAGEINVQTLDYVKRALDDLIEGANTGGQRNQARILDNMRRNILKDVDAQAPDFRAARAAYQDPMRVKTAMENGTNMFDTTKGAMSPKAFERALTEMDESERAAFMIGSRARIAQIMGTSRNDVLRAINELQDKGWNREKLGLLIGDERATRLFKALDNQRTFTGTDDVVRRNSETAARIKAKEDFEGAPTTGRKGLIQSALDLDFGSAIRAPFQRVSDSLATDRGRRIADEMGGMLTASGEDRGRMLERLLEIGQLNERRRISREQAETMARGLLRSPTQTTGRYETGGSF